MLLPSIVHQISLYRNLFIGFKKNISSKLSNYINACTGVLDVFWQPLPCGRRYYLEPEVLRPAD